ncbi:unnamed protein product [Agarophyton chilense]|eukprot:gb/GEZJ01001413.1/.p1 GENE.gb/GEZJ01001413.1/~~gb/GEZJ01001413.1/.p1  ORF type:complete len:1016 (+),score=196.96 gb/GEZJ01001413.1/:5849-8896(+)
MPEDIPIIDLLDDSDPEFPEFFQPPTFSSATPARCVSSSHLPQQNTNLTHTKSLPTPSLLPPLFIDSDSDQEILQPVSNQRTPLHHSQILDDSDDEVQFVPPPSSLMDRLGPRRPTVTTPAASSQLFTFPALNPSLPSSSTGIQHPPTIVLDSPHAFDASSFLPQPPSACIASMQSLLSDIPQPSEAAILEAWNAQQLSVLPAQSTSASLDPPPTNSISLVESPAKEEPSAVGKDDLKEILRNNSLSSEATAEKPTPPEMTVSLLKHQRQALAWMLERERDDKPPGNPRGGILADDQGFGKTLSAIALIISDRAIRTSHPDRAGSLIVAPTSVLNQWVREFEDRIEVGYRPRVLMYHGRNRRAMGPLLYEHDVVITSYGVLTNEYPKVLERGEQKMPSRLRAPGPLFQTKWYRVILDEAQAIKNFRSDRCKAAQEVNAVLRWSLTGTPIQNTVDDVYAQFLYLGYMVTSSHKEWVNKYRNPLEGYGRYGQRKKDLMFKKFQALLGVVLLRRAKEDKVDGKSILELPLKTTTVRELSFTKTELQYYHRLELWTVRRMNMVGDAANEYAFTYVTLLRLRQACNHPALCEWDSDKKFSFSDEELDVVEIRMNTKCLFKQLPLDVQKRLYAALGPKSTADHTQQCPICMDLIMEDGIVTKCGHIFCTSDFEKWMSTNETCPFCRTILSNEDEYMSMEGVRKEVHALERRKRRKKRMELDDEEKPEKESKQEIELIFSGKRPSEESNDCDEDRTLKKPHLDEEGDQEEENLDSSSTGDSDSMSDDEDIKPKKENKEKDNQASRSTKIRAFMEDFEKVMKTTNDKVLCFSQWTRMFDLLEVPLKTEGYEFVRLDGAMSVFAREEAMTVFKTRSSCRLFLISLTAGSTGLNLTEANHVFLLDSWWNPAVEDQAVDRVHRIGQTKPVFVTKYKVADTVENQILCIQDRKRSIINGALGVEGLKMIGRRKATMTLLMSLFSDVAENVAQRALQENNQETAQMATDTLEYARMFRSGGDDPWLAP